MIIKKYIAIISILIITIFITGCDWWCCGKKCSSSEPQTEIVILEKNDEQVLGKDLSEIEFIDNEEEK
jgi:hypothetical protein